MPGLWAYESRNSVLIGVRRRRISEAHADDFLAMLASFLIVLRTPSHDAVFGVAKQYQLTVYDAAYLDLAIREGPTSREPRRAADTRGDNGWRRVVSAVICPSALNKALRKGVMRGSDTIYP